MNILNEANLLKKMAILVASLGAIATSAATASAQLDPRPSIFNEPPYNRVAPRPQPRPGERPEPSRGRHGQSPKKHPRPLATNGAPPPRPRSEGTPPAPPAGAQRRRNQPPRPGQAPPRLGESRTPPSTNPVPPAPPDRVYDAPNPLGNGTQPLPPRSPNTPPTVPPPGSP